MKNLIEHDIPLCQRPEWKKVRFGENYWADFTVMGDHILISQPCGYATLSDLQQSLALNHEVIQTGIAENAPYIQIEDYTNLTGSTLNARKYFIQERSNWKNLIAVIFCATSPMMKLSIELGKHIYSTPFGVHMTDGLSEAKDLALQLLRQQNISYASALPANHQEKGPGTGSIREWIVQVDDFSLQFEILDGDILHPAPNGPLQKDHIDPVFAMQQKIFEENGLKDNAYYIVSDLKSIKGASMETRRYFVKRLRKWHQSHPFKMLIFYNANWIMRAAINISKTTAPYPVYVVDNLADAKNLVAKHKSAYNRHDPSEPDPFKQGNEIQLKQLNELFTILAGISWESQTPESILQKVDLHHPFRQIVEAISLIKMDVDHLLAEKELTEKTLLESSERYKTILNNIEEGYYEVDLAGNLTFFNPSLSTILGFSEEEMKGMNYQRFSSKDDVIKIYKTFNQVFKTGQPAKALDWTLVRKDGTQCFIEASVALISDKGNNIPCGFRGICRDITQRIESEHEKQKLADRLRQAQKMEAMGTLAGGVAHDLNNILSGIVSYPDLLLMKLPPASPLRKPIETIKKSGEKAAAIVQDLLTLARRGISNREIANLNSIITDYLKSPEHNYLLLYHPLVEVTSHLDSTLLNMSASSIHVIKILMNLISNAAEAMPDGGTIHLSTENFYLDTPLPGLPIFKKGDYIKLQISDEGIGMSDEDKERIFEPFYTKKAMGRSGSGLGMALVWGAVQDHDGYIDIQSAPGKGTIITIYFPAIRTEPPVRQNDFSLDRFKGAGETVLVVDDLQDQRELAAELLTQLGYSVKTTPSGEAAIEYLKNNQVDLVILDMIMHPGIDGLDTYKGIIAMHPSQKAIIATGFSTSDRILTAQSLGAGACLKKPYLLKDLAELIRKELDR